MTADELVNYLMLSPNMQLARSAVEVHVKNGRGLGYPDCWIREFVLAFPPTGTLTSVPAQEEQELMMHARRKLCNACKTNMQEQRNLPFVRKDAKSETWMSGIRHCTYKIADEKNKASPDQTKITALWDQIEGYVNELAKLRK